ncbi:BrnA antitoxin family protein [Ancylobacter sp.]|uniref:BrnA antitoxin family protein n=1 Tax=Ancylobacter sp. TaxID=1872567 RepID=UPI003D11F0AB
MATTPTRRTLGSARDMAEAAFKSATAAPAPQLPAAKAPSLPNARELVSLRLDRDVVEHFQEGGPGWQDRMNAALRKAAGL